MFTKSRIGYVFLLMSFVLGVTCFLYFNVYRWALYPGIVFSLTFVFQLFLIVRNSELNSSLKKDIYTLSGLLMIVIASNIMWVFVFQWFKYFASIFSLVFIYVLYTRLQEKNMNN